LRRSQIFWKVVVLVCGISGSTARAQQLAVPSSSLADELPTAASSFLASPTQDPAAPKTPVDAKGGSDTKPSGGSIGNAYYPPTSNTWVKTYQRWGTQLALDGVGDILKEFWPEINRAIFHNKY